MNQPFALAIIANSSTPYRTHLHQRIARELPEIRLYSVFTHETSNSPWVFTAPPEIGAVSFGEGESSERQSTWVRQPNEWKRGGRIIRFLRERHVRAIVMMGYNDAGRVRVMRWAHRHGVRCLLFGDSNIRGDRATGVKAAVKRLFLRRVLSWCDGVLVCGSLGKAYFEKYGCPSDRIYYFPYEPDYELIRAVDTATMDRVMQRFGLTHGRRRLIFSGRLIALKRVDLVIDAFSRLAERWNDWDLLIIGDGALRGELEGRVPADVRARVFWTGFLDDQAAVSALYRCGDVLVVPSDIEPWGLVVNEGVAAGLAVVSSDVVGAAAELVRDGVNGRLFRAGDLEGLVAVLEDVMERSAQMKAESASVLAAWRQRGDPVRRLRAALQR